MVSRRSRSKSKNPSKRNNKRNPSKRSKRGSKRKHNNSRKRKSMKGGVYYSFNEKDKVGGLPAVVRHTDDCPTVSPQSANFGSAIYNAAKGQSGGACNCGVVAGGSKGRKSGNKKSKSKKKKTSGKKKKNKHNLSSKKNHKNKGSNC